MGGGRPPFFCKGTLMARESDEGSARLLAIRQLAAEKNLARDVVFSAVESAIASSYRSEGESGPSVQVTLDPTNGAINAFYEKTIVPEVEDENLEMALDEAQQYKTDAKLGEVIRFQLPDNESRVAAQTVKQVVLQRLREAEREAIYEEYIDKEGDLVLGTVQRIEPRQTIVEIGRGTEAVLPNHEQVRNEHLRQGQRIKVVLLEVNKATKGPQIVVSRSHRSLIRRLFEVEVPEVSQGRVEIISIAREAGHRSKVAVHSRITSIDPIGACVGVRSSRIQNVVNELGGERIDIVKWDKDPSVFISNALSPVQVTGVNTEDEYRSTVVVPDSMVSLAIGREGQNGRLAAKLTGYWINISSEAGVARADESTSEIGEAPSPFEPYPQLPEGIEPDLDILKVRDELLARETAKPEPAPVPVTPEPVKDEVVSGTEVESPAEEEQDFNAMLSEMEVPDEETRESEAYGEEVADENEEYEVPVTINEEEGLTAIRFAEDVLPERSTEDDDQKKKKRRAPRRYEDEEDEDFEYSGRIH